MDSRQICRTAVLGLALIGASACDQKKDAAATATNTTAAPGEPARGAPRPDPLNPPSKAFAQFERFDTGKFYSTKQWTMPDPKAAPGTDYIVINYVYADDRFKDVHSYDTDVQLRIAKTGSADKAAAGLAKRIADSVPIAEADKVKLPRCVGSKSDSDNFSGPEKLVKRIPNPRGGEIVVFRAGDFNMYDCKRGSNGDETASWTEGEYAFSASALPMKPGDVTDGRAEEFMVDYVKALGPR